MRLILACLCMALLCGIADAQKRPERIVIENPAPCAYVTRVILVDADNDEAVDAIQYTTSASPKTSIYFYRGPAIWRLWTDEPKAYLPADMSLEKGFRLPEAGEIGTVDLAGPDTAYPRPLDSSRMRKTFRKATEVLVRYRKDGGFTDAMYAEYRTWLLKRFTDDVRPDPLIACVDACACLHARAIFVK